MLRGFLDFVHNIDIRTLKFIKADLVSILDITPHPFDPKECFQCIQEKTRKKSDLKIQKSKSKIRNAKRGSSKMLKRMNQRNKYFRGSIKLQKILHPLAVGYVI